MSVSNYNATDIRNDLAAMKAREERASYVGQMHFKNIVDSGMRLANAIDSFTARTNLLSMTMSS